MATQTALNVPQLRAALHNSPVGHTIHWHVQVSSTMTIGHELAVQPDVIAGTVVVTEEQTAGRGRLRRQWVASAGKALLCTIILKPPLAPVMLAHLPMMAGVAVVRAIETVAPALAGRVRIKWPNDVLLVDAAGRAGKVAGVLIESSYRGAELDYALVGIGINVNQTAVDLPMLSGDALPATSICLGLGAAVDRTALFIVLCRELSQRLAPAMPRTSDLFAEWRSLLSTLGQQVTIHPVGSAAEQPFSGCAVDVTADGSLIVEDVHGARRRFTAGDATLRSGLG